MIQVYAGNGGVGMLPSNGASERRALQRHKKPCFLAGRPIAASVPAPGCHRFVDGGHTRCAAVPTGNILLPGGATGKAPPSVSFAEPAILPGAAGTPQQPPFHGWLHLCSTLQRVVGGKGDLGEVAGSFRPVPTTHIHPVADASAHILRFVLTSDQATESPRLERLLTGVRVLWDDTPLRSIRSPGAPGVTPVDANRGNLRECGQYDRRFLYVPVGPRPATAATWRARRQTLTGQSGQHGGKYSGRDPNGHLR